MCKFDDYYFYLLPDFCVFRVVYCVNVELRGSINMTVSRLQDNVEATGMLVSLNDFTTLDDSCGLGRKVYN